MHSYGSNLRVGVSNLYCCLGWSSSFSAMCSARMQVKKSMQKYVFKCFLMLKNMSPVLDDQQSVQHPLGITRTLKALVMVSYPGKTASLAHFILMSK